MNILLHVNFKSYINKQQIVLQEISIFTLTTNSGFHIYWGQECILGANGRIALPGPADCFQKADIFLLQHLSSMYWIKAAPIEAENGEKDVWDGCRNIQNFVHITATKQQKLFKE